MEERDSHREVDDEPRRGPRSRIIIYLVIIAAAAYMMSRFEQWGWLEEDGQQLSLPPSTGPQEADNPE